MFWSIAPARVTCDSVTGEPPPPLIRDMQSLHDKLCRHRQYFGKIRAYNSLIIALYYIFNDKTLITWQSAQCSRWPGLLSVLSTLCDREQRSRCPAHNHDNYAPAVGGMHDLFNSAIYVTSLHTVTLVTWKLRDKRTFKWAVGHFIVMCSLWWSSHGNTIMYLHSLHLFTKAKRKGALMNFKH